MVMVNGTLYLDTGHESKIEARCGVMDGEITSQVDGNKQPSVINPILVQDMVINTGQLREPLNSL